MLATISCIAASALLHYFPGLIHRTGGTEESLKRLANFLVFKHLWFTFEDLAVYLGKRGVLGEVLEDEGVGWNMDICLVQLLLGTRVQGEHWGTVEANYAWYLQDNGQASD
jgi:hypothetical protein